MAEPFKVEVDDSIREFARKFSSELGPALTMGMLRAAQQVQGSVNEVVGLRLNKYGRAKGRLANSFTPGPLKTSANKFVIDVTSTVPYSLIHHYGGVIKPRRVKALAIPNYSYSPIIRNNAAIAPREFDPGRTKLKFFPPVSTAPGRLRGYLVDKNSGELAYTLMAFVKIKPTNYLGEAVELALPNIKDEIESVMKAAKEAAARAT